MTLHGLAGDGVDLQPRARPVRIGGIGQALPKRNAQQARIDMEHVSGEAGRLAPATRIDHDLARAGVALEVLHDRLRRGHRPKAQYDLGHEPVNGAGVAQEGVVGVDHERAIVRPAAHARKWVGQDRVAQAPGQTSHCRG